MLVEFCTPESPVSLERPKEVVASNVGFGVGDTTVGDGTLQKSDRSLVGISRECRWEGRTRGSVIPCTVGKKSCQQVLRSVASSVCGVLLGRFQSLFGEREAPGRRQCLHEHVPRCGEIPYGTETCHLHTAIWLGKCQSILTQEERSSEPGLVCHRISPFSPTTCWPAGPMSHEWPSIQPEGHAQPGHAPLPEDTNSDRLGSAPHGPPHQRWCPAPTRTAPGPASQGHVCAHSGWRPRCVSWNTRGRHGSTASSQMSREQKHIYLTRPARKKPHRLSPTNSWERRVPSSYHPGDYRKSGCRFFRNIRNLMRDIFFELIKNRNGHPCGVICRRLQMSSLLNRHGREILFFFFHATSLSYCCCVLDTS